MTDYLNILEVAANSFQSQLHKYRLMAAQGVGIHIFLEGDVDKLLYPAIVRHMTSEEVYIYERHGYNGVLSAAKEVESLGLGYGKTLFFVDSDFSRYTGDKDFSQKGVFFTKYYSVESYAFSIDSVRVSVCELDNVESTSEHVVNCWNSVLSSFQEFAGRMKFLSAVIIAAREAGQKPNLNNLTFGSGTRTRGSTLLPGFLSAALKRIGIDSSVLDRNRIRYWKNILSKDEPLEWIRGKYLFWFLRTSIRSYFLENRDQIGANSKGKPFRCRVSSMGESAFASEVLPRMTPPPDVKAYITQVLAA